MGDTGESGFVGSARAGTQLMADFINLQRNIVDLSLAPCLHIVREVTVNAIY